MRLRLFLEGVEVPVIAAQVQVAPNSPAQCSIQIPPLPEGTRLLPRTLVHLYFLDFYETASPFPVREGASTVTDLDPNKYEGEQALAAAEEEAKFQDRDYRNGRYKLLFGGEIVGFQWTKNVSQRSLVLQCTDWSNYWDYAYQWNNTDLFGPGVKALFSGGATNLFTDFLEDEGSAIVRIVQTPSVQYPNLKGLLGGIVHLLEAVGGSYYYGKQFAGENIFFSIAELRLHITQLITAYEKDPTASRLLGGDGWDSLFGRTLGGLGQQVSIRQAINALMAIIFHETYAQPCPLYVPGTGNSPSGQKRMNVRKDPKNAFVATTADNLLRSIGLVRQAITQLSAGTGSAGLEEALFVSLGDMKKTCTQTAARIKDKSVLPVRSVYTSAAKAFDQALVKARMWLLKTNAGGDFFGSDPLFKKPGTNNGPAAVNKALDEAQTELKKASQFETVSTPKASQPSRLNQQIFRPDVWFSAPPRCNVLFPENYHTLNYQRDFLSEPTRLLLKTNDEFFGEDELFDQFYFAPKGFTLKSGGRELQDMLANDLLDHELFTGILPVFEKMGEFNIFGARSGTVGGGEPTGVGGALKSLGKALGTAAGGGSKSTAKYSGTGLAPKIGLAQRTTNFLYFKYRFAARKMSVTGKFNPYIACGFPGLIIDKYVDPAKVELRQQLILLNGGSSSDEINTLLGTHFLGDFIEVMHVVDQQQGTTQLNCGYARQPEESVEFLGVIRADQVVRKRFEKDASRTTIVAALEPPKLHSLGPNLGDITAVEEVTDAYKSTEISSGKKLPLYQGPATIGTKRPRINVPVGIFGLADLFGPDVAALVGNPDEVIVFRGFRVTEDVPRYRRETVDLPAEEYIRPGWYGDVWHPALIGQAYQSFFQTGAITDEQQVDIGTKASVGVPWAAAEQALADATKAVNADDPLCHAPGLLALDTDSSVEAAVNFIVMTYSYVKSQGLDVDDFIRTYTWRPIATMVDMFGTSDLTLDQDGHSVIRGIEGFHSRAFGPYDDLFGLVTPDIENILGMKRGSTAAQRGDVRKRRQEAVQNMVGVLEYARAVLG
jgi:hypothetical protein